MKGVSPLVATVLLVAVTVSIAGLIMMFASAYTKQATLSVQNKTDEALDCTGASIKINGAFLTNGTAGSARVQVVNNGLKSGLSIVSGQLYNKTGYNFTALNFTTAGIDKGQIIIMNFPVISIPTCADFSYVTVTTNCPSAEDKFTGPITCG